MLAESVPSTGDEGRGEVSGRIGVYWPDDVRRVERGGLRGGLGYGEKGKGREWNGGGND